jgi:hypothetical protein
MNKFVREHPETLKIIKILLVFFAVLIFSWKYYNKYQKIKEIRNSSIRQKDLEGTYFGFINKYKGTRLTIRNIKSVSEKDTLFLLYSIIGKFDIIKNDTLFVSIKKKVVWSKNDKLGKGKFSRNSSGKIYLESLTKDKWHYTFYKKIE